MHDAAKPAHAAFSSILLLAACASADGETVMDFSPIDEVVPGIEAGPIAVLDAPSEPCE